MIKNMKKHPFFLPFAGCKNRCVYCNQRTITGVNKIPSPQDVIEELKVLKEAVEVCFFGGSFCRLGIETIKDYLDAVVNHAPSGSRIRFSTYPNDLNDKKLRDTVLSYPIACIELGVQSLDSEVLSLCHRDIDPSEVLDSLAELREENIPLAVQLMIGLPGQTESSSMSDICKLAKIKGAAEWQIRIYPCLVMENTELYTMMQENKYTPLSLNEAIRWGGKLIDKATSFGFTLIKAGVQETEELALQVRGGPHHPALGELMIGESFVYRLIRLNPNGPWVIPAIHMSKLIGHNQYGLKRLAELSDMSGEEIREKLSFFPSDKTSI